jgi:uncharacterized protein
MSQTLSLYRLQQIDTQLDRAQARLQAIQKTLEDDIELRQAREQAESAEARHKSAQQALKQAEVEVQAQRIKIEQVESGLYGGTVHNPKELQDLQNDSAALKRHLATLEDQLLEAMLEVEAAESAIQSARSGLQVAEARWMEQNRSLHEEQKGLQKEIETRSTERSAASSTIPADVMNLYVQLRQQRRGVAVASISDNACEACGSTLTQAHIQTARSPGQIARCPSCGRILYGS